MWLYTCTLQFEVWRHNHIHRPPLWPGDVRYIFNHGPLSRGDLNSSASLAEIKHRRHNFLEILLLTHRRTNASPSTTRLDQHRQCHKSGSRQLLCLQQNIRYVYDHTSFSAPCHVIYRCPHPLLRRTKVRPTSRTHEIEDHDLCYDLRYFFNGGCVYLFPLAWFIGTIIHA